MAGGATGARRPSTEFAAFTEPALSSASSTWVGRSWRELRLLQKDGQWDISRLPALRPHLPIAAPMYICLNTTAGTLERPKPSEQGHDPDVGQRPHHRCADLTSRRLHQQGARKVPQSKRSQRCSHCSRAALVICSSSRPASPLGAPRGMAALQDAIWRMVAAPDVLNRISFVLDTRRHRPQPRSYHLGAAMPLRWAT
jgi:hypothetical protein